MTRTEKAIAHLKHLISFLEEGSHMSDNKLAIQWLTDAVELLGEASDTVAAGTSSTTAFGGGPPSPEGEG